MRYCKHIQGHLRLWLFAVVFIVHVFSPVVQVGDSRLATATALSIVREADLDLDEYELRPSYSGRYDVDVVDGSVYWAFPWPAALPLVPVVAVGEVLHSTFGLVDMESLAVGERTWRLEKPIATLLVAATSVVLYMLALELLTGSEQRRRLRAAIAALVFAFGTSAWSTASMALWSHAASLLILSSMLLCAVRFDRSVRFRWALGALAACAYAVRPTNLLPVVAMTIWLLLVHRRNVLRPMVSGLVVFAVFVGVNVANHGSILPSYYDNGRLSLSTLSPEALVGLLASPARGLLIFSPVALLSLFGMVIAWRRRQLSPLLLLAGVVPALHWCALGTFDHWWGGVSYGPRLFTDMFPFFFLSSLPLVNVLHLKWSSGALAMVVIIIVTSIAINAQGALVRASWCWNVEPVHIDEKPSRLWDWRDAQFTSGVRAMISEGPLPAVFDRCNEANANESKE